MGYLQNGSPPFFGGKWYGGRLGGSPPFSVLDFAFGVYAVFFVHFGCSDCNVCVTRGINIDP